MYQNRIKTEEKNLLTTEEVTDISEGDKNQQTGTKCRIGEVGERGLWGVARRNRVQSFQARFPNLQFKVSAECNR